MGKPKRNISGNALKRREQFLTEACAAEAQQEEHAPTETQCPKTEDVEEPNPIAPKAEDLSGSPALQGENNAETPADDAEDEEETDEAEASLSKKNLLAQFLKAKKNEVEADTFYLPNELYDAFRGVWNDRKRAVRRGYKKSHLIIEALLRHPDIVEELKRKGILKS